MRNSLYTIFFIFTLTVCKSDKINYKYVILDPNSISDNYFPFDDYKSTYKLTEDELRRTKKIIFSAISAEQTDDSLLLSSATIDKYYRQYFPYINIKDEKVLLVNCFCRLMDVPYELENGEYQWRKQDWHKKLIRPNDGGDCYWYILINFSTDDYRLMINGN